MIFRPLTRLHHFVSNNFSGRPCGNGLSRTWPGPWHLHCMLGLCLVLGFSHPEGSVLLRSQQNLTHSSNVIQTVNFARLFMRPLQPPSSAERLGYGKSYVLPLFTCLMSTPRLSKVVGAAVHPRRYIAWLLVSAVSAILFLYFWISLAQPDCAITRGVKNTCWSWGVPTRGGF